MATAKITTVRFGAEDLAILAEVEKQTGLFSQADALRYVLRQYARDHGIATAAAIKPKPKPKRSK